MTYLLLSCLFLTAPPEAVVEPAVFDPAVVEPAVVEPAVFEPVGVEPAATEPATSKPAAAEPETATLTWPPAPSKIDRAMGSDRLLRAAALSAGPTANPFPVESDEWLENDPLLVIDSEMGSVVSDYRDGDLKRPHETLQPRIIARLDRMIALLEKRKAGAGGGNGSMPAGDSGLGGGPKQGGELRAADDASRGMHKLPKDQREKIMQSGADGFPPGFEDVLSDYYKRLAEAD